MPAQITTMPPRSQTKIDVGMVSSPGWSNTIRGLILLAERIPDALPNAFAPSNHPFQSGESHCGRDAPVVKSLRLT